MKTRMKFSSLFTQFHDPDSQLFLKVAFGTNFLGVVGSWLAHNWYVLAGFAVASFWPMFMSWQKHREELRHTRAMNELEEKKAYKELTGENDEQ